MRLSLNEVEALARNATRGAGYSWGLAEDSGRAVRWLQEYDLEGAAALAELLSGEKAATPTVTGVVWTANDPLCPLTCGTALYDLAAGITDDGLRLGPTRHPLLLVPFAAWTAEATLRPLRLTWTDADLSFGTQGVARNGPGLTSALAPEVQLHRLPESIPGNGPTHTRAALDFETFEVLNRLAQRTYAPATEASRLAGAGAGLTDND